MYQKWKIFVICTIWYTVKYLIFQIPYNLVYENSLLFVWNFNKHLNMWILNPAGKVMLVQYPFQPLPKKKIVPCSKKIVPLQKKIQKPPNHTKKKFKNPKTALPSFQISSWHPHLFPQKPPIPSPSDARIPCPIPSRHCEIANPPPVIVNPSHPIPSLRTRPIPSRHCEPVRVKQSSDFVLLDCFVPRNDENAVNHRFISVIVCVSICHLPSFLIRNF